MATINDFENFLLSLKGSEAKILSEFRMKQLDINVNGDSFKNPSTREVGLRRRE